MPLAEFMVELQEFLRALTSQTRQRILFLFVDNEERSVSQVAQAIGLGQSTTSEHLSILRRAGLLRARREGKETYYRPDAARVRLLMQKLNEMISRCCRVDPQ